MSWGFFLDVRMTLPEPAWRRLKSSRAGDYPTPAGWWGLKD